VRGNVAQDQPAAGGVDLLVQRDELAQGGTRKIIDVAEVEQQLAAAQLVHKAEKLFADDLDVLLVENLLVDEVDDGDITDVLDFQASSPRLCGHGSNPKSE